MNLTNPQNLIHPEDHTCRPEDRRYAQMSLVPKVILSAIPVCEEFATRLDDSPIAFDAGQTVADQEIAERREASKKRHQERASRKNPAAVSAEASAAVVAVAESVVPVKLRLIETPDEAKQRREAETAEAEQLEAARRVKREKKEAEQRAVEAQNAADFNAALESFLSGEFYLDLRTHDPKQPFHCHVGYEDGTLCDRVKRNLARPNGGFIVTDDPLTEAQVVLDVCGFHFKAADEARVRIMKEHPELVRRYITLEDLGLVGAFLDDGLRGLKRLRDQRRSNRSRRGSQGPGGGQQGQEAKPDEKKDAPKDPPPDPAVEARKLAKPEKDVACKVGVTPEAQAEIDALNAPKRNPSRTTIGEALAAKFGIKVAADGETVDA